MEQLDISFSPENTEEYENALIDHEFPVDQVLILGKTFDIHFLNDDEKTDCDGEMILREQQISLRLHPALQYNQDTLLHEVIHAVEEIMHLKLKEHQVHQLAVGLMSVLKQNPELTEWLTK